MSSTFPNSPKLLKGALVVYEDDSPGPPPKIIPFQFNPAEVTRKLATREPGAMPRSAGQAKEDVHRVPVPPVETISMTVELDATDQLEFPDKHSAVKDHGLHPALATLEMLLYPPSDQVRRNETLAREGEVQLSPPVVPLTMLVWGKSRVVPVLLKGFSVTEEAFDQNLNPIQAKVELSVQVLTYVELKPTSIGRDAYMAFQTTKEQLAKKYEAGEGAEPIGGLLPM